jgi:transcriptional antiterminator NusG
MSDETTPSAPAPEHAAPPEAPVTVADAPAPVVEPEPVAAVHVPEPDAPAVAPTETVTEVPEPAAEAEVEKPKPAKKPRAKKAPAAEAPEPAVTAEPAPDAPPAENKKKWYAIKVASGREDSIKAAILRKVRIEGLEEFFGRIEIPFEEETVKKSVKVKDKKTGETSYQEKKVTRKRKKFQGYIFAELEFNDRVLYVIRDTSGVGDFLNLRHKKDQLPTPEPMPDHEVQSMLTGVAVKDPSKPKKVKIDFEKGDKVRVKEGSFANFEGIVREIIEAKDPTEPPKVSVELTFWGRATVTEFDSSQVEKV